MSQPKNPYIVLGIPRNADVNEVKRAYRRLVLAFHPDRCQGEGSQRLLEVQQAYDTLGDPDARRSYDVTHPAQQAPRRSDVQSDQPPAPEPVAVEPLVPPPITYSQWRHGLRFTPHPFATSSAADLGSRSRFRYTPLDEMLGGSVPEVVHRPASVQKDLFVEVILTQEEARAGGTFPLTIPIQQPCRACLGSGLGSLTANCARCAGRGFDLKYKEMELVVPAGVEHGQEANLDVQTEGPPLRLRVLVRVA